MVPIGLESDSWARARISPVPQSAKQLSGAGRTSQFIEGQLPGGLPAALRTVLHVPPRPQQTRALGVEQHHKRLRHRIDVEPEIGPPTGRCRVAIQIEALQDASKSHSIGIEEPRAVTRLQNERFHALDHRPKTRRSSLNGIAIV
jgi:hypothetical protein